VAAALQDNHRATIVGQPTPPIGYVRSMVPLPDGQGSLILTTGVLERASAPPRPVDGADRPWSLRPDHIVSINPEDEKVAMAWLRAQESPDAPADRAAPPADAQLAKALELLKEAMGGAN